MFKCSFFFPHSLFNTYFFLSIWPLVWGIWGLSGKLVLNSEMFLSFKSDRLLVDGWGEKGWGEKEAYEVSRRENMLIQSRVDLRVGLWSGEFCMHFEVKDNEIFWRIGSYGMREKDKGRIVWTAERMKFPPAELAMDIRRAVFGVRSEVQLWCWFVFIGGWCWNLGRGPGWSCESRYWCVDSFKNKEDARDHQKNEGS